MQLHVKEVEIFKITYNFCFIPTVFHLEKGKQVLKKGLAPHNRNGERSPSHGCGPIVLRRVQLLLMDQISLTHCNDWNANFHFWFHIQSCCFSKQPTSAELPIKCHRADILNQDCFSSLMLPDSSPCTFASISTVIPVIIFRMRLQLKRMQLYSET